MVLKTAVLAVSNLRDAAEFYGKILGLEINQRGRELCIGDCPLKLVEGIARHSEDSYLYHVALKVPNRKSLGAVLRRAMEFEEIVEGFADHLVSESIYFRDFDGIGVEIYVDRPREMWPKIKGGYKMDTLPLDVRSLLREAGIRPSGLELGHIHMRVANLEEVERYYNSLGFRTTYRWRNAVFLAYGDYHHHFAFNSWRIPRPREGVGLLEVRLELNVDVFDPLGTRIVGI